MNARRTIFILVFGAVVLVTVSLLLRHQHQRTEDAAPEITAQIVLSNISNYSQAAAGEITGAVQHLRTLQDSMGDWKTPIEFYGKVIDENGTPVSDAAVFFRWTDLSQAGHSTATTKSDSQGLFSLTGANGKFLSVEVDKPGCYFSKSNLTGFFYAGENVNFAPDPNNPVLFRLQKKGLPEPLIRTAFPSFAKYFQLTNMIPAEFDLAKGRVVKFGDGDLQVQYELSDKQAARRGKRFDWKLTVSVRNGGLLESTNEFDFFAPDLGYLPTYELFMSASSDLWLSEVHKTFFASLPGGMYARISMRLLARNGIFTYDAFVNPSGSRNLEYDPLVQAAYR
jgi:hypothetical protein